MAALLKNLYNKDYIQILCKNIQLHYPSFNSKMLSDSIFDTAWENKELKQRMRHIATTLATYLPSNYEDSLSVLKPSFQEMDVKFALENMIFQDYVEVYGLDDFQASMQALECFTVGSSSEFAIRQFILKYPQDSMKQMLLWARSENEHLRRLASEGCRPRLPWAIALPLYKKNPTSVLKILEILKDDTSKYVQKSVANNLNDISKDNPDIVKKITKKWIGKSDTRDWILKHGCRTLLKNSDKEVLSLFGFFSNTDLKIQDFTCTDNATENIPVEFSFSLVSSRNLGKLRIEYAIDFLRQNNKYNTKVFKISESTYQTTTKQVAKHYSFKPISTRKYYKGLHFLRIIVNGEVLKEEKFMLK